MQPITTKTMPAMTEPESTVITPTTTRMTAAIDSNVPMINVRSEELRTMEVT